MLEKNYLVLKNNWYENIYPVQAIDLQFQANLINQKGNQSHQRYRGATANARLFMISIRQREIKMILDGNKNSEIVVFWDRTIENV